MYSYKQDRAKLQDYIVDIRHLNLKHGNETTVVIRNSGHVDFYWNNKMIESSEDDEVFFKYTKVNMNFQSIILRR